MTARRILHSPPYINSIGQSSHCSSVYHISTKFFTHHCIVSSLILAYSSLWTVLIIFFVNVKDLAESRWPDTCIHGHVLCPRTFVVDFWYCKIWQAPGLVNLPVTSSMSCPLVTIKYGYPDAIVRFVRWIVHPNDKLVIPVLYCCRRYHRGACISILLHHFA